MVVRRSLMHLGAAVFAVTLGLCIACTNSGGSGGDSAGGDGENVAPDPIRCADNSLPGGELVFPPVDGTVVAGPGGAEFIWNVADRDGGPIVSTVFVGDGPDVFEQPLSTEEVVGEIGADDASAQQRVSLTLTQAGVFYWGVRIVDECGAVIQRPADGRGSSFVAASAGGAARADASDVVLICPRDSQPARRETTFEWSMGDTVAEEIALFVSRADRPNPFDDPLLVLRDIAADQTRVSLESENLLPIAEELSWGLRIETADQVLFTFEGQLGPRFTAAENVPPSGELLGPAAESVLADNTAPLLLRWQADAGNCEDALTSTVYFEYLGEGTSPLALFESSEFERLEGGRLELDAATVRARLDRGGRWAWGVLADDGTDSTVLRTAAPATGFLTFLRNTAPKFTAAPAVGWRACGPESAPAGTVEFAYTDDNGLDTVTVTLSYAGLEADVFDDPAATVTFTPDEIRSFADDVAIVVDGDGRAGCLLFGHGLGFYGVELNDGVNDPVRAVIQYAGPDCNNNGRSDKLETLAHGDFSGDGKVDLLDFPGLDACLGGPELPPSPGRAECQDTCRRVFDFDADSNVDFLDFADFTTRF